MRAIRIIAFQEWRSLFLTPLAWSLLGMLFMITGYMFGASVLDYQKRLMRYESFGVVEDLSLTDWTVVPTLGNGAVLLLLIIPLLTMRLFAEEKRRGSWPALASSPLTPMTIILGKYLGLLLFLLVAVGMLAIPPLTLLFFGHPDIGQILAGLLGVFLVGAAFGAVGLGASSATDNPIVAAVAGFGVLLLLWLLSWMGGVGESALFQVLAYLSPMNHYPHFLSGVIRSGDLAYFFLLSATGLLFARQRLVAARLEG
ncbi:MAG: ABC transporter permease subunit [Magnetococcales bacterium]|nr:ABC transporter permease subunit [Magnetococcales bacterium]